MNNNFSIRLAELKDLTYLARIFDSYRTFYNQPPDVAAAYSFLKERLNKMESVIYIALSDEQNILGFAQMYRTFSSISMRPALILNDLYVDVNHRNLGIASKLLAQVKNHAAQNNCAWITLQTSISNASAQQLYRKHGFTQETDFLTFNHS